MPPKNKNKNTVNTCKECNQAVQLNDKGIECDICERWLHTKCINMNDLQYNLYKGDNSLDWVCKNCIKNSKEEHGVYELISKMMKKNEEDNKKERGEMKDMMKKLSSQMKNMEDKLESKIEEKVKKSEKEIMTKVQVEVDEKLERYARKNNLIIYGMPECREGGEENRERMDKQNIRELMEELETEIEEYKTIRLGREYNETRVRPVKVELKNENEKYYVGIRGNGEKR